MNKYKIYKIINKDGNVISNHNSYATIKGAKSGASNCVYRMDLDTKIAEFEVTEVPTNEIKINLSITTTTRKNWNGETVPHEIKRILGYGDLEKKITPIKTEDKISFNK